MRKEVAVKVIKLLKEGVSCCICGLKLKKGSSVIKIGNTFRACEGHSSTQVDDFINGNNRKPGGLLDMTGQELTQVVENFT